MFLLWFTEARIMSAFTHSSSTPNLKMLMTHNYINYFNCVYMQYAHSHDTHMHVCTHIHTHKRAHTHTHTHTQTHTHTHTHTQVGEPQKGISQWCLTQSMQDQSMKQFTKILAHYPIKTWPHHPPMGTSPCNQPQSPVWTASSHMSTQRRLCNAMRM